MSWVVNRRFSLSTILGVEMKKQTKKVLAKLLRSKRKSAKTRDLRMEMLEGRRVMAGDASAPLHNALIAADVNRDFSVSPLDALLVINALHKARATSGAAAGEGELPSSSTKTPPKFYDVSNDGRLSPLDALLVINQLRGEGEDPVKLVSYSIQFFDPSDTQFQNPITQASVGQTVVAAVFVKDLRKLANPLDLPDFNNTDPADGGTAAFPVASEGDVDRNGNGIVDIGPDDTFATGVFSAGVDLDLTGSETLANLVTHVRPAGGFLNSITFGPRLSGFPDGSAGPVDSDQEFNEISAFDLSLNLDPLQDQGIDPTRFERFFTTRFTLLKPGSFTITPNAAEDTTLTNIRFFRSDGITVPANQQTFIPGSLTILADATAPVAANDSVSTPEETAIILAGAGSTLSPALTANDTFTRVARFP